MAWNWFSSAEARRLGDELAEIFIKQVPVQQSLTAKDFRTKTHKTLKAMSTRVSQYSAEQKPSFFQKAKFANRFKWRLLDAGYSQSYVGEMTEWLLLQF